MAKNILANIFTPRVPKRYYGWKPGKKDPRDHWYVPRPRDLASVKPMVDWRNQDGPIFDQGQLGSCVANGWLGDLQFICKREFGYLFQGSRLQAYYDGRVLGGTVDEDSGLEVRDLAKCLSSIGVCPESEWPYVISRFTQKPPAQCYVDAAKCKIVEYKAIQQDLYHLKSALDEGHPFVFGFNVPRSFESQTVARTGVMPMPRPGEQIVGGHCVMGIGYIDADGKAHFASSLDALTYRVNRAVVGIQHWLRSLTGIRLLKVQPPGDVIICRNSWGTAWGEGGYFYMPYKFITDPKWASDFWMVSGMTNPQAQS